MRHMTWRVIEEAPAMPASADLVRIAWYEVLVVFFGLDMLRFSIVIYITIGKLITYHERSVID